MSAAGVFSDRDEAARLLGGLWQRLAGDPQVASNLKDVASPFHFVLQQPSFVIAVNPTIDSTTRVDVGDSIPSGGVTLRMSATDMHLLFAGTLNLVAMYSRRQLIVEGDWRQLFKNALPLRLRGRQIYLDLLASRPDTKRLLPEPPMPAAAVLGAQ